MNAEHHFCFTVVTFSCVLLDINIFFLKRFPMRPTKKATTAPKIFITSGECGCVSNLVVVADEDVNRRQEQLKHRLLVTLFHLKTQTLQEAGRSFGTLAAAVLEAARNSE